VTLPGDVSAEKADAQFENGILTLTLPKAGEAKAEMIAGRQKTKSRAVKNADRRSVGPHFICQGIFQ
jgi:hypothetical protein